MVLATFFTSHSFNSLHVLLPFIHLRSSFETLARTDSIRKQAPVPTPTHSVIVPLSLSGGLIESDETRGSRLMAQMTLLAPAAK